jgi:peptide/nickel transport system permease protein
MVKVFRTFLLYFLIIIILLIIFSLVDGFSKSNLSINSTIETINLYLKNKITGKETLTSTNIPASSFITQAFYRTLILLILSSIISLIIGIFTGIYKGLSKDGTKGTLLEIFMQSLPEIFTIVLFQGIIVLLHKMGIKIFGVVASKNITDLILPAIAISLVSSIYISRILAFEIRRELDKEYIRYAYARGVDEKKIFWSQVYINIEKTLLSSIKVAMSILFSSMIIAEYLFSYPGLGLNSVDLISKGDYFVAFELITLLLVIFGIFELIITVIVKGVSKWNTSL